MWLFKRHIRAVPGASLSSPCLTPCPHLSLSSPIVLSQGHPHVTLAYLLVEAADVAELQSQLQVKIRNQVQQEGHQGESPPLAVKPWEMTGPLLERCWLGQAGVRAKEAAARLLEKQRDNVVLVGALGAMQAMMGRTTVREGLSDASGDEIDSSSG